jgi:DNA mismatch endonuclease, patch repair protein
MKLGRIPPASSETTRRSMKGNRGSGTHLELRLRSALASRGINGYACNFPVEGVKVDIAFPARKVAVLAHGCFWHSCPTCRLPVPKSHRSYWNRKFAINRRRDRLIRARLVRKGWKLAEVWGHEVDEDLGGIVTRIQGLLGD